MRVFSLLACLILLLIGCSSPTYAQTGWGTMSNLGSFYRLGQVIRVTINSTLSGTIGIDMMNTLYSGTTTVSLAPADRTNTAGVARNVTFTLPTANNLFNRFTVNGAALYGTPFYFRVYNSSNDVQDFNSTSFIVYAQPTLTWPGVSAYPTVMPGQTWNISLRLTNVASMKLIVRYTSGQTEWKFPIVSQQFPAASLNGSVSFSTLWTVPTDLTLGPNSLSYGTLYYFDAVEDSDAGYQVALISSNSLGLQISNTTSQCSSLGYYPTCNACLSHFLSCQWCPFGTVNNPYSSCYSSTQTNSSDCNRSPLFVGRDTSICPNNTRSSNTVFTATALTTSYYGALAVYNLSVFQSEYVFDSTVIPVTFTLYAESSNLTRPGMIVGSASFGGANGNRASGIIDLPSKTSLIANGVYSPTNRYFFVATSTSLSITVVTSVYTFLQPSVTAVTAFSAGGSSQNFYIGQRVYLTWSGIGVSQYSVWLSPANSNATQYALVNASSALSAYVTLSNSIPASIDGTPTAYILWLGSPNPDVVPVSRTFYIFPASVDPGTNVRTSFWGSFVNLDSQYRIGQAFARFTLNSIINGSINMDLMSTLYPGAVSLNLGASDRINLINITRNLVNVNLPSLGLMASRYGVPESYLWGSSYYLRVSNANNPSQDFNSSSFVMWSSPSLTWAQVTGDTAIMPGQTYNMTMILSSVGSLTVNLRYYVNGVGNVWSAPIFVQQFPTSYLNMSNVVFTYIWTFPANMTFAGNPLSVGTTYYIDTLETTTSNNIYQFLQNNPITVTPSNTTSSCASASTCNACLSHYLSCSSCPFGSTTYCFSNTQTFATECPRSPLYSGRDLSVCPNVTRSISPNGFVSMLNYRQLTYNFPAAVNVTVTQNSVSFSQVAVPVTISLWPEGGNLTKKGYVVSTTNLGGVNGNKASVLVDLPSKSVLMQAGAFSPLGKYYLVAAAPSISFTTLSDTLTLSNGYVQSVYVTNPIGSSGAYNLNGRINVGWTSAGVTEFQIYLSPTIAGTTKYNLTGVFSAGNLFSATLPTNIPASTNGTIYYAWVAPTDPLVAPGVSSPFTIYPATSIPADPAGTSNAGNGTCVPGKAGCNSSFARAAVTAASPLAILVALMTIMLLA